MIATKPLKPRACKHCKSSFTPTKSMQVVCGPMCGLERARLQREAKERKQQAERKKLDRAMDAIKRRSMETIPQLIKAAQREFNAFIRERDRDQPCICCGLPLGAGEVGGAYDCGHYRSTGSASHLRFDERNAHAQRKVCNRWGAGRAVDYRIGLVARLGLEAVEALESNNEPVKWTREVLREIATVYRSKTRDLKRSQQ